MTTSPGHAHVTNAQARRTALVVASVLLLIAGWNLYQGRAVVAGVVGGVGLTLALAGLLIPPVARRFHVIWMRVALALGWVNSRVILSVLYYAVFTPYGLVSRVVGRDPLGRREPDKPTYWMPRATTRQAKERFERLF